MFLESAESDLLRLNFSLATEKKTHKQRTERKKEKTNTLRKWNSNVSRFDKIRVGDNAMISWTKGNHYVQLNYSLDDRMSFCAVRNGVSHCSRVEVNCKGGKVINRRGERRDKLADVIRKERERKKTDLQLSLTRGL